MIDKVKARRRSNYVTRHMILSRNLDREVRVEDDSSVTEVRIVDKASPNQ